MLRNAASANSSPIKIRRAGVVRLNRQDLVDQQRPRFSRGELTPFSQRGSAVLFEDVSAVEVTVMVEMVVDRGMGSGKFLESFYVPESRHCSFSSASQPRHTS